MAKKTMDEIVASGLPFNPMSGVDGQGRAYSGATAEKLRAGMAKHGWDDPRFMTETQVAKLGLALVPDAQKSMVLHRDGPDAPWDKIFVYNGTQVAGLPNLADMQVAARKALGIGLSMAELVERGTPFNPLSSPDGQGRPYTESNQAALKKAMGDYGWDDPRFLTHAQITSGGWSVKDGATNLTVWAPGKDGWEEKPVVHASDVVGLPSLETMVKDASIAQAKALVAAAERGAGEEEFTGVVMNPLSGNGGKVFGGKTAEKLHKAMAANEWNDGRFVTKGQAEYAGMTVASDAQAVIVNFPTQKGLVPVSLYNAAVVDGMPTMAEMYAKVANLPSVEHAAMALDGEPFAPLAVNPNAPGELKGGRDALKGAMEQHGWNDPRFVSFAQLDAWTQKLTVIEGEKPVVVDGVKVYNAAQLEGLPELPNLPAWQEMHYQNEILAKEQRKEQDSKEMAKGGLAPTPTSTLSDAYNTFWTRAAVDAQLVQTEVIAAAANVGVKVNPAKVAELLTTGKMADGEYVGKVVGVDVERGLVYQSQGRGRGEVLLMDALSRPVAESETGTKLAIHVKDGKGVIAERAAGKEKGLGR